MEKMNPISKRVYNVRSGKIVNCYTSLNKKDIPVVLNTSKPWHNIYICTVQKGAGAFARKSKFDIKDMMIN